MITMKRWTTVAIAAAGLLALGLGDAALAKQGRGRGRGGDSKADRVNEKLRLDVVDTTTVAPRKARLRIRRKKASRSELRLQLHDANPGFDLTVWFEDAGGAMSQVGALRESNDDDGDVSYKWRVRTKKGEALPFGVSDLADLSGRAIEVRNGTSVVVDGVMPSISAATAAAGKRATVRTPLATDDTFAAGTSDDAVKAEIRVRRKDGDEQLKIEVEHLASGLSLSAWIEDDAGALQQVGDLFEEEAGEYELEIESEHGALPFGVASLSELADRAVEVRTSAGDVVASGFVPELGAADGSDADDDDRSGSGSGDDSDDDSDDDDSDDDDSDDDDSDDDDSTDDDSSSDS